MSTPTAQVRGAPPALRPATLDDYPAIRRLEESHGLLTLSDEDWRALWLGNPARASADRDMPPGWILEDDHGTIVGSLTNIPSVYTLGGRDYLAATGRAWVVEPRYRGFALWLLDEYFNQPGVDLYLNSTVNGLAVESFRSFGSERIPVGDWEHAAYRITNHRAFAASALRIKRVPAPGAFAPFLALALRLADAFRPDESATPLPTTRGAVRSPDGFDTRFDAFWHELMKGNPQTLLAVRDHATLAWHFASPLRSKGLWVLTVERDGLVRAYAILKRQDHPPSGLTRMRLVDFQTLEPEADHLPALVGEAIRRCEASRIAVLEHVGCGLTRMKAFEDRAPLRRTLPAWPFYFMAADPSLSEALRDRAVWAPSAYDGDTSL